MIRSSHLFEFSYSHLEQGTEVLVVLLSLYTSDFSQTLQSNITKHGDIEEFVD